MNYLAHIYLSGNNEDLKIGNFIADFLKPKEVFVLPKLQQEGVKLHHKIDRFTDTHKEVRAVRTIFFDEFRHYSAVLVDVIFDYYLAKNWADYHNTPLTVYAQNFYQLLLTRKSNLPSGVQEVIPFITKGDWLSSYAHLDGLTRILKQMNKRTKNATALHSCITTLTTNDEFIAYQFRSFFRDLKEYSAQEIKQIRN